MHIIDIVIVLIYIVICILIGLYKAKSIRTLKEYALGSNYFPNIIIVPTLFATHLGAGSVMGRIEKVYTIGIFFIVTQIFCPLSWILASKIYGENISQFRGCISLTDIMQQL